MKNLIIVLLFLFTSTSLLAVNKEIVKTHYEHKTEISNSVLVNQTDILSQSVADLLEDVYGNCKITLTFVNGDGEEVGSVSIDTNTDTAQECKDLADSIFDLLLER